MLGVDDLGGPLRADCLGTMSPHQTSRPSVQSTSLPVRLTTSTFSIDGVSARATSAICLSGTTAPAR